MANIDSKTNDEVRRSEPVMMHCVKVNPRQVYCYHWIEYYSGFREHVVLFFFYCRRFVKDKSFMDQNGSLFLKLQIYMELCVLLLSQ